MPVTVEDSRRVQEVAPPVQETATVEALHSITAVKDTVSRATINKSNGVVSNQLKRSLASSMKLSKTAFSSVSRVFSTFTGLKRIAGGI